MSQDLLVCIYPLEVYLIILPSCSMRKGYYLVLLVCFTAFMGTLTNCFCPEIAIYCYFSCKIMTIFEIQTIYGVFTSLCSHLSAYLLVNSPKSTWSAKFITPVLPFWNAIPASKKQVLAHRTLGRKDNSILGDSP